MIIYFTANSYKQLRSLYLWGVKHIALNFTSITRQRERIPVLKQVEKHKDKINWLLYANESSPEYEKWVEHGYFSHHFVFEEKDTKIYPGEYSVLSKKIIRDDAIKELALKKKVALWGGKHLDLYGPFYLITEWTYAERYGDCYLFLPTSNYWKYVKHDEIKDEIKKHKTKLKNMGYDPKRIINGDKTELIRLTVESWKNYANRLITISSKPPVALITDGTKEGETVRELVGEVDEPFGILPTGMRVNCSNCTLSGTCSEYEEGMMCKINKVFAHYQDNTLDGCIDTLARLCEESMTRLKRARAFETSLGETHSKTILKEITETRRNVEALFKAIKTRDEVKPPGDGDSVLSKIFGKAAPAKPKTIIVKKETN